MEEEKKNVKVEEKKKNVKVAEKKKQTKAKGEKKKGKNVAIGIIIAIAMIAIIAAAVGVALFSNSPKNTLNTILTALKTGDYKNIENYEELIAATGMLDGDESDEEIQKLLFDKLEWNIKSEKREGNTATIEIDITNKDFKTIIGNYTQKIIKLAFGGGEISEEQMKNYLMDELKNEEIGVVTESKTITMKKKDGKWGIEDVESTIYSLLPGFQEALEAIM